MIRKNSIRLVVVSFGHAIRGVRWVLLSEPNFRIHLVAAFTIVMLGLAFSISITEWISLVLAIGLVLMAETMNTAIEYLADALHPDQDPEVGKAKDAAAGAVMISAIAAFVVGLIVFIPKLWNLIQNILSLIG